MSLKLARFRQFTSVGEVAGFVVAWVVGLWVASQAAVSGDERGSPSNLASATEVSRPAATIK